ncbi:hypothetical protein [Anaerobiospirillum succiniciproducens]
MALIVDRLLDWCAGNGDRCGGVAVDSTRARSISARALEMNLVN